MRFAFIGIVIRWVDYFLLRVDGRIDVEFQEID